MFSPRLLRESKGLAAIALTLILIFSSNTSLQKASAQTATLTEWTLPDGNSGPWGIATDQSGKIWFTENQSNSRIGMLDPVTSVLKEWDLPTGTSNPRSIYVKPGGTSIYVYFAEYHADRVGYFDNGTNTFYEWTLQAGARPVSIGVDDSGNMWFTESGLDAIGMITPSSNVYVEYKLPTDQPAGVAPSVDCGETHSQLCVWGLAVQTVQTVSGTNTFIWFTELANNAIGRFEARSQALTLFDLTPINPFKYQPMDITLDPQGNVVFTSISDQANRLSVIRNQTNTLADFTIPTSQAKPTSVRWDSSRSVAWFTEYRSGKVSNLKTTGAVFTFLPHVVACTIAGTNPGAPPCGDGAARNTPSTGSSSSTKNPRTSLLSASLITTVTPQSTNQFTEYPLPTTNSGPNSVAIDPSGNIVFTEQQSSGNRIGRMTVIVPFSFGVSVTSQATVTIAQGQAANYSVNVNLISGSTQTVALSIQNLPTGINPPAFNPPVGLPPFTSTLTIGTTSATPAGSYSLTIQASGGGVTKTTSVSLVVLSTPPPPAFDFSVSVAGSNSAEITAGETASFSLGVTLLAGSPQSVQLTASSVPAGATSSFDPATGSPSFTSTLTLSTSVDTSPGTYNVQITALGGGTSHQIGVTLTINAPPRDFSVDASPNAINLVQASSGTLAVTVQSTGVFNDPVTLAASNLPAGISVSFSPNPVIPPPGGTTISTATVTVTRSAPTGTSTFTIAGTSGSLVKQVTITVHVSGCLIATATYGSELSPEVQFLREFRDNQILRTSAGSNFMFVFNVWYYSFSPSVANYIATHQTARTITKIVLYPLIGLLHVSSGSYSLLSAQPEIAALVAGLVASSLIGLAYVSPLLTGTLWLARRRLRGVELRKTARLLSQLLAVLIAVFVIAELFALPAAIMFASSAIVLTTLAMGGLLPALAVVQHAKRRL